MSKPRLLLFLTLLLITPKLTAQTVLPLYPGNIPNSKPNRVTEATLEREGKLFGYRNVSNPTLAVYLPPKGEANGTAVIICPGGGYAMESYQLEGIAIAQTFVRHGTTAFILKYRLPNDSTMQDKSIGPLQDAQQAIKLVRQRAAEWQINPAKIGIMGFSAGGHLASTAGTHFTKSLIDNKENISLRPDFMILVYPVISMSDQLAHKGSRENLLGKNPPADQIKLFSNELQVNATTPPTWLTHSGDDTVVDVDNSITFYEALRHHNVPAEMHLYPTGNHGFVLKLPTEEWMQPLFTWMKKNNWLAQ